MTVIRKWSGDGLAGGATIGTTTVGIGDTAFNKADSGFTTDNTGARPPRIALADGSGRNELGWLTGTLANYAVRFYFTCTGGASNTMIVRGYNTTGYSSATWNIGFNSTGNTLRLVPSGTGVVWSAASAITFGTTYRVELKVDSAGNATIAVYEGDSTTQWDGGSGNVGALNLLACSFGRCSGASTSTGLRLDDLAIADTATFIGPAVTAPPPAVYTFYRINAGGSLTPCNMTAL